MMKCSKVFLTNLIISCMMSIWLITVLLGAGFFETSFLKELIDIELTIQMEVFLFFLVIEIICFLMLNFIFLPIYLIKMLSKTKDVINEKYVDTKQSIYTRDLPIYNASIAGEIIDFKSTFEEEYIAGVIELISKGYIMENEHQLIVNKAKSPETLLKNEKYILQTCEEMNTDLRFINSYHFYKELKEDMYELGIYKKTVFFRKIIDKIRYYIKTYNKKYTIIGIYTFFAIFAFCMINFIENFVRNVIILILLYFVAIIFIRKNKLTKERRNRKRKNGEIKIVFRKRNKF